MLRNAEAESRCRQWPRVQYTVPARRAAHFDVLICSWMSMKMGGFRSNLKIMSAALWVGGGGRRIAT